MTTPELVTRIEPDCRRSGRDAKIQGEVILECIIQEDETVAVSKVLKPVALVQQAAQDAVMQWRYRPAMLNGRPQVVYLVVRIKFNLS